MKQQIKKSINMVHRFVFGGDAGAQTMIFTKNVSMSFSGGIVAFGVLFVASIIAARVLGPEEYGKYVVIFSIAQMVSLFFVLELDVTALYFLSKKQQQNKSIVASINIMFLINIFVFTLLAIGIFKFIKPQNISQTIFVVAILMGFVFAAKRMIDAFLRTQNYFKKQSIYKVAESITTISILVVFLYLLNYVQYISYVVAIILGGVVFIILGGIVVRDKLIISGATKQQMNRIFKYNIFGIVGASINSIIKNIDKLIVVAFLGVGVGGVYAIYFTASVIVGARLTQLFMNVFFPSIRAQHANIKKIFLKMNILFKKTFLLTILIASCGVFVIILLYGPQYPVVWYWILLGGIYIAVHFFASLYGWLLSSISKNGYKQYNLSFVYGLIGYSTFLGFMFVNDLFGITALLVALIIYRLVGGFVSFAVIRKKVQ